MTSLGLLLPLNGAGRRSARMGRNVIIPSAAIIVLLHGGGFVAGSAASHREIAWQLCCSSDMPGLSANYRLAPQFPYAAQIGDASAACAALTELGFTRA